MSETGYRERASRIAGATVWWRRLTTSATHRVLPDGCIDLIWHDGDLFVAGPDRHAFVTSSAAGASYVGLRLPPGMGPAVFGTPADRLLNQRIAVCDVWGPAQARRIADGVGDAASSGSPAWTGGHGTPAEAAALEQAVLSRLAVNDPDPIAARIVGALDAGSSVDEIAHALGLSPRQLHRRSVAAFGYGPKTLARIRRMQRALAVPASVPGAMVAAVAGYADQAHLAREVRALAGVPFGQLNR